MKALTLYQPWATLVTIGAKRIETRSWGTSYRGPLAIHAGLSLPKIAKVFMQSDLVKSVLEKAGLTTADLYMAMGHVVATCDLTNCVEIAGWPIVKEEYLREGKTVFTIPPDEPELSFGDYTEGRYAWVLENIKPLTEPIPAKGKQRIWEWTP